MVVPFIDMSAELRPIRSEIDAAIARVLDSGVFIGGPEVDAFERELASFVGCRHVVGVSSGSDALLVTYMALGIGPGDEVVTTPFTFFSTAGSAARLGAKVVFADIDDVTLCLDPDRALAAVTPRTRAIVPVNLFGRPADLASSAPCPVIEDAAQSIGSGGVRGLAATVSFFPTKNLGALGDGGAVLTDDDALADRIRLLRNHGARPKYHHVALGGNFRLDALQAAVLRVKLRHLPVWTAARCARARELRAAITAGRVLAPGWQIRVPADHPDHVWHQLVIRTSRRDELRAHLAARGIATEIYYPEPLHLQPCFAGPDHAEGSMPVAEAACREVLALPARLTAADLEGGGAR